MMSDDPWVSYFDFEKYGFVNPTTGKPYCRVHLGRMIRRSQWPKPTQVSPNRIAWRLSELKHHERQLEVARAYREPSEAAE
jgi:hypothetical protein